MQPWMQLHAALDGLGIIGFPLEAEDAGARLQRWRRAFLPERPDDPRGPVPSGYLWHAYSYGREPALQGAAALQAYADCPDTDLFAYFETERLVFDIQGHRAPRLDALSRDVYVFPTSLRWSIAFTHEAALGLGPYFARKRAMVSR